MEVFSLEDLSKVESAGNSAQPLRPDRYYGQ